jgi:hypothetical protein
MTIIKLSVFNQFLKSQTKNELEQEIKELFKKFPQVQEHFTAILSPDNKSVLLKYKKIIDKEFKPMGKNILRYPIIKSAIKDFSNVSTNKEDIADLMLFTVECGVEFTLSFGDIDQRFYSTFVKIFHQSLEHISENDLENEFYERCKIITEDSNNIGWGFGISITELFQDYLGHLDVE